jgi:hypothetical protein
MSGIQIRKAQRAKAWVKLVIDGVSGSGKTYSALQIARGLGENPILIDTENGSGELYSHLYPYDYIRLTPPFTPAKYVEAIDAAIRNGNDVIIIDSTSHCWKYILQYKESLDTANPKAGFTNWAKAKSLFDECKTALLQCPAHIICTLRAGSEYAESYDAKGNKKFDKVGTKPIAEPDLEYEFTLALRIERSHLATATKDRTERFDIAAPFTPSPTTGRILREWLNEGVGDLEKSWDGVLQGEEVKRSLDEAERLGVGHEGITDEELQIQAVELLNMKRREANAKIKALGLDQDKDGLTVFSKKAKGASLDPLELFWEFSKKREGLKTWKEFQLLLDEYIKAKNVAEGKPSTSSPTPSGKSAGEGASPSSSDEQKTFSDERGKKAIKKPGEGSEGSEGPGKGEAEEKPSSEPSTPNSDAIKKLTDEFIKSREKATILKRSDNIGIGINDLIQTLVSSNPKARLIDLVAHLDELEARGR